MMKYITAFVIVLGVINAYGQDNPQSGQLDGTFWLHCAERTKESLIIVYGTCGKNAWYDFRILRESLLKEYEVYEDFYNKTEATYAKMRSRAFLNASVPRLIKEIDRFYTDELNAKISLIDCFRFMAAAVSGLDGDSQMEMIGYLRWVSENPEPSDSTDIKLRLSAKTLEDSLAITAVEHLKYLTEHDLWKRTLTEQYQKGFNISMGY